MFKTLLGLLLLVALVRGSDEQLAKILKLKALRDSGVLNEHEYKVRRDALIDEYVGTPSQKIDHTIPRYRIVRDNNIKVGNSTVNWTMPMIFTPQVDWLLHVFNNNMPRSYDDTLPFTGKSYWKSMTYITDGAIDYNGTRLAFDNEIAIQERALTHVGLNLYDGGVWAVSLALSGLHEMVDVYHRNVLMTSSTGSNPQVNGLKSIRAWEPNPDPIHPPSLFYYGRDQVANTDLPKITMPMNLSFVLFKAGCDCPSAGCCAQIGDKQIPGNFYYRMIGPTYLLPDPLEGMYSYQWRAEPIGTNPDPAQWWNGAGVIHWNDWKPITGENVWGIILGPMQVLMIKNCSRIPKFTTFKDAPDEVQLAISILPAASALQSSLGSMYHCPKGTKMFPPDPSEETNVSNENNFSAWASYKALYFILDNWYTSGDPTLDAAKMTVNNLIQGLDHWFATYLLPKPIKGENVVSQGGHVTFAGVYQPQGGDQAFAVDCQTWGMMVYGSRRFDAAYGSTTTAYGVWQSTKKLAGFYINGQLAGVGYTTPQSNHTKPDIWSGEWTWGAIFSCRKMAAEYTAQGKTAWAADLLADAKSMETLMMQAVTPGKDGVWIGGGLVQNDGSYLYANKRFFIPWGWYANPIGATSSTGWAVFNDFQYDPFVLGGFFPDNGWIKDQCKDNPVDPAIIAKLKAYYNY